MGLLVTTIVLSNLILLAVTPYDIAVDVNILIRFIARIDKYAIILPVNLPIYAGDIIHVPVEIGTLAGAWLPAG